MVSPPLRNQTARPTSVFRFNGDPGCSSLSGLLTENGPFTYEAGTHATVQNPYTWVNLTNMMYVSPLKKCQDSWIHVFRDHLGYPGVLQTSGSLPLSQAIPYLF